MSAWRALALLLLAMPGAALGGQVHVRSGSEEGQAILFADGGACFGLTPLHVMQTEEAVVSQQDPTRLSGVAALVRDLGNDLALIEVRGQIAGACTEPLPRTEDVAALLQAREGAVRVRTEFSDGTLLFHDARVEIGDSMRLKLREVGDWSIGGSDSGSAVMQDGSILGILLADGDGDEPATVLRWDFATYLADWELTRGSGPAAVPAAAASLAGVVVLGSNAVPLDPASGPERLVAPPGEGGGFRARAAAWPVTIELQLPGDASVEVAALTLERDPEAPGAYSQQVEIQRARSGSSFSNFIELQTLSATGPGDRIEFPPGQRARKLRLLIPGTWDKGTEIAIRRIGVETRP